MYQGSVQGPLISPQRASTQEQLPSLSPMVWLSRDAPADTPGAPTRAGAGVRHRWPQPDGPAGCGSCCPPCPCTCSAPWHCSTSALEHTQPATAQRVTLQQADCGSSKTGSSTTHIRQQRPHLESGMTDVNRLSPWAAERPAIRIGLARGAGRILGRSAGEGMRCR